MKIKIDWKKRLTNKVTLAALAAAVVGGIYGICAALGIDLPKSQEAVMAIISTILTVLTLLGIIVDPTTEGLSDGEKVIAEIKQLKENDTK